MGYGRAVLAIFDNDGTICDTQEVEGRCYALAIERVTGRPLPTIDWSAYTEPTCTAIIREILSGDARAEEKEESIREDFFRLLKQEQPKFPGDFSPLAGAVEFIERLQDERICPVAISTGCFADSAAFKLECCGI